MATIELSTGERHLLELIWRYGPVSRKKLAELGGVTGASATRLTRKALDLGLISESVLRSGEAGQPVKPLQRATNGIYSLGVSFDITSFSGAIAKFDGAFICTIKTKAELITIDTIADFTEQLIAAGEEKGVARADILGVGLAIPGYRARQTGHWAMHWDFPALLTIDIENELTRRLSLPVVARRDAIAAAWAERLLGRGKLVDDFVVVYCAQGVGGALFSGGQLVSGACGNAGGLGALFPYDAPRPSHTDYAAFMKSAGADTTQREAESIEDALADEWIRSVTPGLRAALNQISRLYDPSMVVLSGTLPRQVLDRLAIEVNFDHVDTRYTDDLPTPTVTSSSIQHSALISGAASLPIANLIYDR